MRKVFSGFFKTSTKVISSVLVCIGLVGIVMVFSFSKPAPKLCSPEICEPKSPFVVTGVEIPDSIDFAGERVPVENFDVKESLERELLINSYWHSQTLLLLKKSTRYFGAIEPILKKYNLPDDFKFLVLAESGLSNVSSPAGAVGFWQFLPATAKEYGLEVNDEIDERYHMEKSTVAACKMLLSSFNVYKSWTMAAASYNTGRQGLNKQIKRQYTDNYYDILLNDETARYIFRIVALKMILNDPKKYGFDISKKDYYQPIPYSELTVNKPITDLAKFAFEKGTNYKILKMLNPWFRSNVLTNKTGKSYVIKIPEPGFRKFKKELPEEDINRIEKQSEQLVQ
jgi:hypothetical protein